jgi:hypothetical protein
MANTIIPYINDYAETQIAEGAKPEFVGITENPAEGVENIPIVYGTRQVDGVRLWTYVPTSNTNLLYVVYALSEGWCRGIDQVFIDDQDVGITSTSLAHRTPTSIGLSTYAGLVDIEFVDGRSAEAKYGSVAATNIGPSALLARDLAINKSYSKLAYLVCRFTYSDPSPFRSIPNVSVVMRGRYLADLNSTSISPTMTRNPVEILWDLLSDTTYGAGATYSQMDYTSFNAAKNTCNAVVRTGSTISTFLCNWICDTSKPLLTNINYLLDSYKMSLSLIQGKYVLNLESNPSDSDGSGGGLTFGVDNIVSDISVQYPNLNNKYNKVTVDYPDKDTNFQPRSQSWPSTSNNPYLTEDGGIVLETRFSADTITDYWHASDLAQMILVKSRNQKIYRFTADKTAHRLRVGDYIFINTTYPLISNQKVIVLSMAMNNDYTFDLECADWAPTYYPTGFTNTPTAPPGGTQQPPGGGGVVQPTPVPTPVPIPPPEPAQTFTLAANGTTFNEGASVTFTLTTTGVTNGTVVNWQLDGATNSEISPTALSGSLTISSNSATYSLTIANDAVTEGTESWTFKIISTSNGAELASRVINVQDTSLSPPPPTYNKTYTGASFLDFVDVNNVLQPNNDWYITGLNPSGAFDLTEVQCNGTTVPVFTGAPLPSLNTAQNNRHVRQRIMKRTAGVGVAYCTLDMDISLVDRRTLSDSVVRNIFCVYDNWTAYRASRGYPLKMIERLVGYNYQLLGFDYQTPPIGVNLLKANYLSPGPAVTGFERIDSNTTTNPGIVRIPAVTGKPGHYSTNLSNTVSARNTIRFPINVGNNPANFPDAGPGGVFFIGRNDLSTSGTSYFRLHFFEVLPVSNQIVQIGQKIIGVGLNRACIPTKYYNGDKSTLTTTIGTGFSNPMPA